METFDVFIYRKIVLNSIIYKNNNSYIIVNYKNLNKNVFSHELGKFKINVNKEFIIKYKEYLFREKQRKINELYDFGFPLEICLLIYSFI